MLSPNERDKSFENARSTLAKLAAKNGQLASSLSLEESFSLVQELIRKDRRRRRKDKGEQPGGESGEARS